MGQEFICEWMENPIDQAILYFLYSFMDDQTKQIIHFDLYIWYWEHPGQSSEFIGTVSGLRTLV